ncbi:cysteine dioxygenase [Shouchella patagoniensis]|uniref:cysteine dioxygenase n=1 Tax=Shouchella patagoniensis TaxID=228576 RepID=UPI000994975F|nr:cysteine dioxygenase family protein [Shouchella patagoniensis]
MFTKRIHQVLGSLKSPNMTELRDAILSLDAKMKDVSPYLMQDEHKPYYRQLLFQSKEVELLVMNWSNLDCAPHDHGNSFGWIQVVSNDCQNTVYKTNDDGIPQELFTQTHRNGKLFLAPRKGIHKMKGRKGLVTLHLYAPPITGMKVYDLQKCAACVVADDCGAWWPEEQRQKIREYQLASPALNKE